MPELPVPDVPAGKRERREPGSEHDQDEENTDESALHVTLSFQTTDHETGRTPPFFRSAGSD